MTPTAEQILGTRLAASFASVPDMWHHRVHSTPDADAMYYRHGGEWQTMSWAEAGNRVRSIANGLLRSQLAVETRCCILAATRVEWVLVDLGILCAGCATTTIYPSTPPAECQYIIADCEAEVVFCDTEAQVAKLVEIRDQIPKVRHVVVFDGRASSDGWVITLATHEQLGDSYAQEAPDAYRDRSTAVARDSMATLIYTSGTTGQPKGVVLTHDAWVYESEAIDGMGMLSPADKQLLFLPLAHVFAKVMQVAFIRLGMPTAIDGDADALVANMGEVRPTFMAAVPRVFEKAYNGIVTRMRDAGGIRYAVFQWAVEVGLEVSRLRQSRREPTGLLRLKHAIADRLVFSRVRERFGGRLRFLISGGAPLSPSIAEFYHACDILVLEGYGLTESGAASCVNHPSDFIFGTVGKPVPGCEARIAEDGEILLRSRGLMRGYYNLPDETAEALTDDGWLRTGDIGVLLDSGHLKITDRKKEIIVTAGGKNIAPAHFQNLLKAQCPYVSQVLMHGDKRPFCVALVSIDEEAVARWARDHNLSFADYADLAARAEVHDLIQGYVDAINRELPSYETVKNIALLPEDLTLEAGYLTPSLKVKRRVVEDRFAQVLDGFYRGAVERV